MFTGLVEAVGELTHRQVMGPGERLSVCCGFSGIEMGESIAVTGVCLTVDGLRPGFFDATVSSETLAKTALGGLRAGASLNLERALRVGDRLGGHLVSGHVDGVAKIIELRSSGDALELTIEAPRALLAFIAVKGSVCLDGVSLTVNAVSDERFSVMLIPHTQSVTNLGGLQVGGLLNIEVDLLARYAARHAEVTGRAASERIGAEASRSGASEPKTEPFGELLARRGFA